MEVGTPLVPASTAAHRLNKFFSDGQVPPQERCDDLALYVTGLTSCSPTPSQGCHSYTVFCCNDLSKVKYHERKDSMHERRPRVVQFRITESRLSLSMIASARMIHGPWVPKTTFEGELGKGDEQPLLVYMMDWIPGSTPRERFVHDILMAPSEEKLHEAFMLDLADYFAAAWHCPQNINYDLSEKQKDIKCVLEIALNSSLPHSIKTAVPSLIASLPTLYSHQYRQVLTHGDLNASNVIVNPETLEINGIVDWASASIQPFGSELFILQMMSGFRDERDGRWHFYANYGHLRQVFWEHFWGTAGIHGDEERQKFLQMVRPAWQLGLLLREGFEHGRDGQLNGRAVEPIPENTAQLELLEEFLADEGLLAVSTGHLAAPDCMASSSDDI